MVNAAKAARTAIRILLLVATAAYMAMLLRHRCYAPVGSDASGYLNEGKLLAAGRVSLPLTPLRTLKITHHDFAYLFIPLGFNLARDRLSIVPGYPPGAPILFALAASVAGWNVGPSLVSPLAALICLIAIVSIARELGAPDFLAIGAAVLLAASPTFIVMAVQPVSDTVATMCALLTIWFALIAHRRPAFAVAAGVALAFGTSTRPSNVLMAIPLAFALRWRMPLLVRAAAGALPIGLALAGWQWALYGHPLRTGYGGASGLLSRSLVEQRFREYHYWLLRLLNGVVWPGGVAVAFDTRVSRMTRAMLITWFFAIFVFYLHYVYGPGESWMYTRFVMPAVPALILGTILVLRDVLARFARPLALAAALIVAGAAAYDTMYTVRLAVLGIDSQEWLYQGTVKYVESHVRKNALVVSGHYSGTFVFYSGRITGRFDQFSPDVFQLMRAYAGVANLQWYAVVAPHEVPQLQSHLPGHWTQVGNFDETVLLRLD